MKTAGNKMFLQWCRDELVLSFNFVQRSRFVGQDAASERHHCRNTNVGSKQLNEDTHPDNIDSPCGL
jgi:hypothetical protein